MGNWSLFDVLTARGAAPEAISYYVPVVVNIPEARRQCEMFTAEMSANRRNCDDAGVARKILSEIDRYGQPTAKTRARLTHWRHTNGSNINVGRPSRKRFVSRFMV